MDKKTIEVMHNMSQDDIVELFESAMSVETAVDTITEFLKRSDRALQKLQAVLEAWNDEN